MSGNYAEESKKNWSKALGQPNNDDLKLGCLQRIATATEIMSLNNQRIQSDLDYYKGRCNRLDNEVSRLLKSRSSLRGVITRMKNKARGDQR